MNTKRDERMETNMATTNDDVYFMVDKYDQEAINQIKEAFGECKAVEEESFAGGAVIVFIVSSVIALANTKAAKSIIDGLFEKDKIKVEYKGMKIEGSYDNVQKTIRKIQREERSHGGY